MCLEQEQQKYKPRFKKTNPEIKKKKKKMKTHLDPDSKTSNALQWSSSLWIFTAMKLAGLKFVENSHNESVWVATWVPATETWPTLLMIGSLDEIVKLWCSDELVLERTNTEHSLGMTSVAAHSSGLISASTSLDSFVHVFDVDTNTTIATLESPPSEVW